ncbi:hypothetical protein V2P20_19410 [Methylobacter sp. Wu1]|uniref:hypothetical protein n=1 Tax=Methylobacter sp. Wu1 TaxID=3119359 RepID=UPI002F93A872
MKQPYKILVIYHSQTGKTKQVLDCFLQPLRGQENISVEEVLIEPVSQFPLPWPKLYFFSIFPECVYEEPVEIKTPAFKEESYDLVILGTQVWFLSISIPFVSFLKHPQSRIINNTHVITVLSCRKMWMQTQKQLEGYIRNLGGSLVGKILVTAQGEQMDTLKATKDNLFDAKEKPNKREWVISGRMLDQVQQQGRDLLSAINKGAVTQAGVFSVQSDAFSDTAFEHPETVARRNFLKWGKWIIKSRPKSILRYGMVLVFLIFFFTMVFVGLPLWPFVKKIKERRFNNQLVRE